MAGLYTWVLEEGIGPCRLVMGCDSAGSGLVLLYPLHLRDHLPTTLFPVAVILHSPSIDMTAAQTQYTPRIKWEFTFSYSQIVPFNNDTIRPKGLPIDTPEISALLWEDVSRLLPQLVYWSSAEVLASDAEMWIERSRKAGVKMTEFKMSGQLHTFSLRWPFTGKNLQDECDVLFVFKHF